MEKVECEAHSVEEFGRIFAREYYRADSYVVEGGGQDARFQLVTAQAGIVPVCHFSGYSLGVRRGWKHIRQWPSKLYVIWFPLEGSISVTQDLASEMVAGTGDMVVTCGDRPFHIRAVGGEAENRCSQLHVLVPSHLMHSHLPEIDQLCGKVFHARSGGAKVARELFAALFREATEMDDRSAERLGIAGLEAIAQVVRNQAGSTPGHSEKDVRLDRILSFIRKNIATQGLAVDDVARGCNVSRRYIHYLMKDHNCTFSQFLWDCRLEQAHEWLTSAAFAHVNIVDIAYMVGFRSASHFSQAYRGKYDCSPKQARKQACLPDLG
jgi:AraC-like DNA-binding protein